MSGLRSRLPPYAPPALVLLIAAAGMVRVLTEHWREGAVLLAGALVVGALLRALLPVEQVGLLAIRSRPIDILCYGGFAVITAALAVTITYNPLAG